MATAILVSLVLRSHVAAANLVTVYLLGVVAVAVRCSRQVAVIVSFLSVAAFDFFCVPPYWTLRVHDYEYLLTFGGMLVVALVISTQTARIRAQAAEAAARESRSDTLFHLSRRLAGQTRLFDVARTAAQYAEEVFEARVVIFLPEDGRVSFSRRSSDPLPVPRAEEPVAQKVLEGGEKARGAAAVYLPLKGARETAGVMCVLPAGGGALAGAQMQLIEVFAHQTAMAMERTQSQNAAESARVQMKTEQMRSSLLSAVSHDLRTPLATITGAASTLRAQGEKLPAETREELLESIFEEAERLSRLVGNLLDMTRLESGVELRRDLYPLEEIVGAALQRMERALGSRQVTTRLPEGLPLVNVDDVLLGQVVMNLLENAIKYTPPGTPIEVEADTTEEWVQLEVRDRGPGFAPEEERRIFEKFYRGKTEGKRGAGLGLAICKAIVEAHRGTIEAYGREGGGAVFRVRLPMRGRE
jgi:two-component system sensor histidine kinase KdpD